MGELVYDIEDVAHKLTLLQGTLSLLRHDDAAGDRNGVVATASLAYGMHESAIDKLNSVTSRLMELARAPGRSA